MSSFVFDSALDSQARGRIDFANDTIKVMLMGEKFIPSQRGQSKRSDIIDAEISGPGYTPGGKSAAVLISQDAGSSTLVINLGGAVWNPSTLKAKGAAYYRAGSKAEDEALIAYVDFAGTLATLNGELAVSESIIKFLNRPTL